MYTVESVVPDPDPTLARTADVAGQSAQREFDRRHDAREKRVRTRHPRIGGALLALVPDEQSTQAWAQGAEGERRVGARLDALRSSGVVVLHDRRVPGKRTNIDHIAVAPSGIWVIDSKRYTGEIRRRDVGGWRRVDVRLYVAGRDRSKLLEGVSRQAEVVRDVLGSEWPDVPIRPALCFIDGVWPTFGRPFELDGVQVSWPKAMAKQVGQAGPCPRDLIERVAAKLDERLSPA
ncbi:MAG: nuclease-related domain-containing protein [Acidimicrobiales bacterium]